MDRATIQLANEAFGCFTFALLMFSGGALVVAAIAIFLQFYWYGGW